MAVSTDVDGPLAVTRRRLGDAVCALADPARVLVGGVYRWSDPLYVTLRGALRGRRGGRIWRVHASVSPCRIDVLALLCEIDATVAGWEPAAVNGGTIERLHTLAGRGWRPQDCQVLDGYCGELERWTLVATELLAETPKVFLRVPCPRCGQRFAYRRNNGGELVRAPALRVSEDGCACLACSAFWPPDRFEWLARLLGCAALPA